MTEFVPGHDTGKTAKDMVNTKDTLAIQNMINGWC